MTTYRPATPDDTPALYEILKASITELIGRMTPGTDAGLDDPDAWERARPIWEHLARTADRSWVALDAGGRLVGYARSILRDGDRELTEFFVLPGSQSGGIGRQLLGRAFPAGEGARHRSIIATGDPRALARYFKTGLVARFAIGTFSRVPERVEVATDLVLEPASPSRPMLAALARLDRRIIGHRRDEDHRFLLVNRAFVAARRGAQIVGYAYGGRSAGPIAAADPADLPALLAWAESVAGERVKPGEEIGFEVPFPNRVAIAHLLGRGYRLDPFLTHFLSDGPAGSFDRYVVTSPPIFI